MAGLHSTNDHASVPQIHFPNPLTLAPPDEETDQQASLMNIARAQWTADAPIVPPPPDLQEVVEEIAKYLKNFIFPLIVYLVNQFWYWFVLV